MIKKILSIIKNLFSKKQLANDKYYIILVDDRITIGDNITFTSCDNLVKGYYHNCDLSNQ